MNKISHPPERTARLLELARETARMSPCPCGARPGYTCDGMGGFHLGRFIETARFGELPEDRMAAVLAVIEPVFTSGTIIPAGAR